MLFDKFKWDSRAELNLLESFRNSDKSVLKSAKYWLFQQNLNPEKLPKNLPFHTVDLSSKLTTSLYYLWPKGVQNFLLIYSRHTEIVILVEDTTFYSFWLASTCSKNCENTRQSHNKHIVYDRCSLHRDYSSSTWWDTKLSECQWLISITSLVWLPTKGCLIVTLFGFSRWALCHSDECFLAFICFFFHDPSLGVPSNWDRNQIISNPIKYAILIIEGAHIKTLLMIFSPVISSLIENFIFAYTVYNLAITDVHTY